MPKFESCNERTMPAAKVVIWILNFLLDFDLEQILVLLQDNPEYMLTRKYHPNSILLPCRLYFGQGLCALTKIWFLIVDYLSGALLSYFAKDIYFSYHRFTFPIGNMCDDRIAFPSQKPNLHCFWFEASCIFSSDCLKLVVCVINQCKMRPSN